MTVFTDKETREIRKTTCESCEHKRDKRCSQCGCFIILLTKINYGKCPLNKW
jgi:hypothetical protein